MRRSGAVLRPPASGSRKVSTPAGWKPGFTARRRTKLRISRPAPISTTTASAISEPPARCACARPARPVVPPRPPSFKAAVRLAPRTCSAGTMPNRMPGEQRNRQREQEQPADRARLRQARHAGRPGVSQNVDRRRWPAAGRAARPPGTAACSPKAAASRCGRGPRPAPRAARISLRRRGAARQQQVGDIDAGHQQQAAHRAPSAPTAPAARRPPVRPAARRPKAASPD